MTNNREDRSRITSYAEVFAGIRSAVGVLASSRTRVLIAMLGIVGVLVAVVMVFLPVHDSLAGIQVSCGSIFSPDRTYSGAQYGCGGALSDRAIEGAAFMIGGLGFLLVPFFAGSLARAFLLVGLCVTSATIINFFEGSYSPLSLIGFVYGLAMTILAGRRGLQKPVDIR